MYQNEWVLNKFNQTHPFFYKTKISIVFYAKDVIYLTDFLTKKSGKGGNPWVIYHVMMEHVWKYEKDYEIKIPLLVDDK